MKYVIIRLFAKFAETLLIELVRLILNLLGHYFCGVKGIMMMFSWGRRDPITGVFSVPRLAYALFTPESVHTY